MQLRKVFRQRTLHKNLQSTAAADDLHPRRFTANLERRAWRWTLLAGKLLCTGTSDDRLRRGGMPDRIIQLITWRSRWWWWRICFRSWQRRWISEKRTRQQLARRNSGRGSATAGTTGAARRTGPEWFVARDRHSRSAGPVLTAIGITAIGSLHVSSRRPWWTQTHRQILSRGDRLPHSSFMQIPIGAPVHKAAEQQQGEYQYGTVPKLKSQLHGPNHGGCTPDRDVW